MDPGGKVAALPESGRRCSTVSTRDGGSPTKVLRYFKVLKVRQILILGSLNRDRGRDAASGNQGRGGKTLISGGIASS